MSRGDYSEITELEKLREIMTSHGCISIVVKKLADNDNSKNQVYLGPGFETLNIIPNNGVYTDTARPGSKRDRFKADLDLYWTDKNGSLSKAPAAQLILYPKYPEVRMSGFLKGCKNPPSGLMAIRLADRLLFLGITRDGKIIGHVVSPDGPVANQFNQMTDLEQIGLFFRLPVSADTGNERDQLLDVLKHIHKADWIDSVRLGSDGELKPCNASNCGGYTLEAQLGISPNSYAEPDYLGWEIKQHGVKSFDKPHSGSPITLMTPEPTAGFYREEGVEKFIRKYGYADVSGKADRLNFGGNFRFGVIAPRTGLVLGLTGYDVKTGKIEDAEGGIVLLSPDGDQAAKWNFADIMKHWNRKHAQACYVTSLCRTDPERQYRYGNLIEMGTGTDFLKFLSAIAQGTVYYDPGIKLEHASSPNPKTKRRSQFRIKKANLACLYDRMELVDVTDSQS